MESVRWVLAAAGVEFDEEFLETKEQLQKLQDGEYGNEITVGNIDCFPRFCFLKIYFYF